MSTVQEIINYADRKYPNQETVANKIEDLNDIHNELFIKIAKLKHAYEQHEFYTVSNQMTYILPSNCHIDNIIKDGVKVATDLTVTANTTFDTYEYAGLNDDIDSGNYYGDGGNGTIDLVKDGKPISTTGYSVRLFFYARPTPLTAATDTPDLDSDYHALLKYGLIQSLASSGNNPDTEIADYYQRKHDDFFKEVEDSLNDKFNKTPTQSNQAKEYW